MAQKRNPISLRLQTRLQGHEKRFTSCWFTDFFFAQAYTNDLTKRLYLGYLLEKNGSWYSERNESNLPETCVSIQFVYRRCSTFSVLLDKRKQEYILSTDSKNGSPRRESTSGSFQQEKKELRFENQGKINEIARNVNGKKIFLSTGALTTVQDTFQQTQGFNYLDKDVFNPALISPGVEGGDLADKRATLSIANLFVSIVSKSNCSIPKWFDADLYSMGVSQLDKSVNQSIFSNNQFAFQKEYKKWLYSTVYFQYNVVPDFSSVFTIESVCDIAFQKKENKKSKQLIDLVDRDQLKDTFLISKEYSNTTVPLTPASHWTSCHFIRATSAFQSVEFCLSSVVFLYKKRFSFPLIKDTFFKMLAASNTVRGARLACSGRQGGRSKSAMRAKKQSAVWGQTALSLFSSRLAFASTSVDTSFGQVGIKVWICYK